ncbi:unnamed protein product, partial [Rotaria magnacalcarata]
MSNRPDALINPSINILNWSEFPNALTQLYVTLFTSDETFSLISIRHKQESTRKRKAIHDHNRIDGPTPTFFLGNVQDFAAIKRISISIRNWTQQFGRIYGYFEGHTPVLVVSDPHLLHQIFREHFSKFHSRRQFP